MAKITKDTTIGQAIQMDPGIIPILMSAGMHCVGCPSSAGETIEEAAMVEDLPLNLEELERQAIMKAVRQSDGNLTQAALLLGISRFTLYRKLEKLGKQ